MACILLIDSNPDNRKSLEGLLRYRTQHEFAVVESHTEGARKAVSLAPDLIMMNVLLFMGNNYAFPRVLQQHDKTSHISFLVQANGQLDEVTERQIIASGMANIVYLPVSAEELESAIQTAIGPSKVPKKQGVASVVWPVAGPPNQETTSLERENKTSEKTPKVKPVQWPSVAKPSQQSKEISPAKKVSFRTFEDQNPPSHPPNKQKSGFQAATFDHLENESQAKGSSEFKTHNWQTVDPKDVKNQR